MNDKPLDLSKGVKNDSGKPMLGLIDPDFVEGLGRVLTHGAKKYAAHNWRNGIAVSRLYDATLRHLNAFNAGEDIDPETNEHHLYHAACELMFLAWTVQKRPALDDRWKP